MPRKKFRRLPDGFGRIIHFGKRNLRNPYTARKRVGSTPEGKPVYKTIGSFPTYAEAFEALVKYHDIEIPPESGISFAELYERFTAEILPLPVRGRPLAQSSIAGYGYSFRAVPALHSRPFVEITAAELQNALENAGGSASKQTKIKLLYSRLYQFADYLGITDRNLSAFVRITTTDHPKRNPFTPDEVLRIWALPRSRWRDATLVLLYTGMRDGELFTVHDIVKNFFRAGEKTDAGIDRVIPLHPAIEDLVPDLFPLSGDINLLQHWFRRNLPGHVPYDCRRTFVTRASECGIIPTAARQIVGHSSGDVHVSVYTKHSPEYLLEEIKKLKYF